MELQYHGGTSVRIITKKQQVVSDPNSDVSSVKLNMKKVNLALASQEAFNVEGGEELFVINGPGEYEFEDTSVKGIATQAFQGASGDKSATIYRFSDLDNSVLFVGNINEKLTEDQLESIGVIDVLIVPVGGNGYTLDATGAASVVRAIEPKLVVPVFYKEDSVKYEVMPATLEAFVKELGMPVEEPVEKYKIKQLPEQATVQPIKVS
jgi:L-ascorbate metabolism protein UlaG (beta-lactamase superfamily)